MAESGAGGSQSPSQLIDERIAALGDWRGQMLARLRALIKEADPDVVEEWKWRGVPVWSHAGIITTGETYKSVVKLTFAKGAALDDPTCLFNSSLDGNVRRAIDFQEGATIDEAALQALIRAGRGPEHVQGQGQEAAGVSSRMVSFIRTLPLRGGAESWARGSPPREKRFPRPWQAGSSSWTT